MNDKEKDVAVAKFFFPWYLESAKRSFRKDDVPDFAVLCCGRYREMAEKAQLDLSVEEDATLQLIENSAKLLIATAWWNQAASGDCYDPVMAIQFCSKYLGEAGLSPSAMGITQSEFDKVKQQLGQ